MLTTGFKRICNHDVFRALRVKQWVKNLLVFAAPVAGSNIGNFVTSLILTFFMFCFASSLGYIYNDWRDRHFDAVNPKKKNRPFASGSMGRNSALFMACVLSTIIALLLIILDNFSLSLIVVTYLCTTFVYTRWLKNVAVVEIITVAGCFVIRSVAGSISSGSTLSQWLFTVIAFGAILIVAGKRLAELSTDSQSRSVLKFYSESFLRSLMTLGACGSLFGFSLWTFNVRGNTTLAQLSLLPFMVCLLRLFWHIDAGKSELSEDFPFRDPVFIAAAVSLLALLLIVVYK